MNPDTDFGLRDLTWRLPLWFVLSLAAIPAATVALSRFFYHPPESLHPGAMVLIPFVLTTPFGLWGPRMAVLGKLAVAFLSLVVLAIITVNALWLGCVVGARCTNKAGAFSAP